MILLMEHSPSEARPIRRGAWVQRAGLGATIPLLAGHVAWLVGSHELPALGLVVLGAAVGMLLLDGLTGLVHWAFDTWGDERTRWVGPVLVHSFREHHDDPRAMVAHDWVQVNRETLGAALLALSVLSLPTIHQSLLARPFAAGVAYGLVGLGSIANQLHLWAHAPSPPRVVGWLQEAGLILSPERHARHHTGLRTSAYCVATGWLNPLLDGLGVWRVLEVGIASMTGARPRAAERGIPTGLL